MLKLIRRLLAPSASLSIIASLHAQPVTPHIGYVYPAGGQQGASFQIKVGGQFLDGVTNAFVSGAGVQAAVYGYRLRLSAPRPDFELRAVPSSLKDMSVSSLFQWLRP
ncbi:MAG: hypothetical protein FJ398_18995 [Verrucomicrobia bacterium]|nr:hypothetical protein [Verrucomicrobiota bacterium]